MNAPALNDTRTVALITGVLLLLTVATAVGQFLARHPDRGLDPAAVRSFNLRLRGWWIMCTVLAAAFWLGTTATVVLCGLVSFWALRAKARIGSAQSTGNSPRMRRCSSEASSGWIRVSQWNITSRPHQRTPDLQ